MSGRRPAFDPSRLDDAMDDLLPPPSVMTGPAPNSVNPPVPEGLPTEPLSPGRSARGSGGRLAAARHTDGISVAAVRIPKPLYDAVVHDLLGRTVERPSYAQIVGWTCEDHPNDVVAELRHAITASARVPRGRKLATDGVPLTLRFHPPERAALDEVVGQVGGGAVQITRTAGVIAALRVAVKHGVSGV